MNTEEPFEAEKPGAGGFGRGVATVIAALLAAGFFFRGCQYGIRWMSRASSPESNYKALALWALFYTLFWVVLALAVYPRPPGRNRQKAERGT